MASEEYYPEFNSEDVIEAAAAAAHGQIPVYSAVPSSNESHSDSDKEHQLRSKRKHFLIQEIKNLRSIKRKERNEEIMREMKSLLKELIIILCRELFGKSRSYNEEQLTEAKSIANQLTTPPEKVSKEEQLIARCRQAACDIFDRNYGKEGYQAGMIKSISRSFPGTPREEIAEKIQQVIDKLKKERNRPPSGRFEKVTV